MCNLKRAYSVRLERAGQYEDIGNESGNGELTLPEAQTWINTNTVRGEVSANDGGPSFQARIVEWV